MGLLKRIGSWNAKLSPEDEQFLSEYLDDPGRFLFSQMSKIDQHHSIAVARQVMVEAAHSDGLEMNLLIKAALLHDVGKVEGDFNFLSRILVGLVKRVRPTLRGKLAVTYPVTFGRRSVTVVMWIWSIPRGERIWPGHSELNLQWLR